MQPLYMAIYSSPHNIKFAHNTYGDVKLIAWEGVLYCTKSAKHSFFRSILLHRGAWQGATLFVIHT